MDCPNLNSMFVRSNDWRMPMDERYQQIGYCYLAGRPKTPWDLPGPPVRTNWNSPQRLTDEPLWVAAADLNYVATCVYRVIIAHGTSGSVVLGQPAFSYQDRYLIPLSQMCSQVQNQFLSGSHNARVDGSVVWSVRKQTQWYRGAKEVDSTTDLQTCVSLW
jgi:hypothetical protein